MTKRVLIFNPFARGKKSRRVRQLITARAGREITVAETSASGDARRLAAQAVADGAKMIIAAGGDGTINEVLNGIGTSGVPLGVIPLGTVNVFARELGLPLQADQAWDVLDQGHTRTIDLGCASTTTGAPRYFMQLAGVGLDAAAVLLASWELKKRIGPMSYVWAGLTALRGPQPTIDVHLADATIGGSGSTVLIGNGRFYGGPFPVFPDAKLDDGQLDVCVFARHRYRDIVRYGQGIARGRHTALDDVRYFQAAAFECRPQSGSVSFQLDGEVAGAAPVSFSVAPRALNVVVPRSPPA